MTPLRLEANQPRRFYLGGEAIARFRGLPADDDHVPEDWVGSTTSVFRSAPLGLTTLPDGRLLRDAVAAEPEPFLGAEHVDAFGADTAVLVKLLDAGERLPVHLHPDGSFVREHLGAPHGKSEAWLVLEGGTIHLGFAGDVEASTLRGWFDTQDSAALLGASNELHVARGDCIYVPAGTPHAIGEGVFILEVQEPSDVGVLLEWERFVPAAAATMGLDPDVALGATRRSAVTRDEIASWIRTSAGAPELRAGARAVVPPEAEPFFRAEWLRPAPAVELEPAFSILGVVEGSGRLAFDGGTLELSRGDTVLVPHGAGAGVLTGALEAIRCLPPRPGATR
jgi:mannose-6-phosphate isomerase